ncbi:hypothetical protein [Aminobacter ciceronei]|uniref:Uncharacterized protein n=1 Tax=Aminobacter ciceronei TaxID=150723 RepID=A0ABR6C5Y4_9HYPH|nr:hypothetical protein [Aminobacter ciceronei]MBA8906460.1 hypothetical protein [Aminobacter ciceronei]MBA9020414.1 hypothetical protein [Aminobacter ciceronei]
MPVSERKATFIAESLKPHQVKAIKVLAGAFGTFEPVGFAPGLAMPMIDWMIENGLAEKGLANEFTGKVGYRLTELGEKVRWSLDKRQPKDRPKIKMIEPRLKPIDFRTVRPFKAK